MRRIVAYNNVSADGYFSALDGNLNWVVQDPELGREAAEASMSHGPGTFLFGRKTYEQFEAFWPNALDDSSTSPDPHQAGHRSPEMRAFAISLTESTKIVFSTSRKDVTWKNSHLVREFDPREIERMKQEPGTDMMIFGSGSIASQLTEHGLIDEYQFIVSPLLLGSGKSLIRDVPKTLKLDLVDAKPYKSGNVMLRYARAS
jgi:dihydrofolate reductase